MKMRVRVAFVLCATAVSSFGQTPDWLRLAETDDFRWDGRAGTLISTINKNGQDIFVASGRLFNKKTTAFSFEKWYATSADCAQGAGKLITTDMQGNYKSETDFVDKGGSVASALAETVCSVQKANAKKGI